MLGFASMISEDALNIKFLERSVKVCTINFQ